MVELMTQNSYSYKINDRKSIAQNFKTVVNLITDELHSCKGENLDASIRPLFVTYITFDFALQLF